MSRKIRNFCSIVGFFFIVAIFLIPIDKSPGSQYAKDWSQLPKKVQKHYADCFSPNGINQQVAERGYVDVLKNGIKPFNGGQGHYQANNRHIENNRFNEYYANHNKQNNPYYENSDQHYENAAAGGQSMISKPLISEPIRKLLMGLLVAYLTWYTYSELRGGKKSSQAKHKAIAKDFGE